MAEYEVEKIFKIICNKIQASKSVQRNPLCLTESNHDFILDKIKFRDTNEYDRDMIVFDK